MPADTQALPLPRPGPPPRRRRLDVGHAPVRRLGAAPAHRLPVAGRAVVLAVRARSACPTGSPTGCGSARCCCAAGLGVRWCGAPARARSARGVRRRRRLPAQPVRAAVRLADVGDAPAVGRRWVDRRLHRSGPHAVERGATRRLIALVVLTVGAVNATALAMIVPAPVLWLVHAAWQRSDHLAPVAGRRRGSVGGADALAVSLWWIVDARRSRAGYGADVLPYSEIAGRRVADVDQHQTSGAASATGCSTSATRMPRTTTESLRLHGVGGVDRHQLRRCRSCASAGWCVVRWAHRRFAALLVAAGIVLAVGVHPIDDPSPLMRLLAGDDEAGLALALRSSTRALPLSTSAGVAGAGSLRRGQRRASAFRRLDVARRSSSPSRCVVRSASSTCPRCGPGPSSTRRSSATRIRLRPGPRRPPRSTRARPRAPRAAAAGRRVRRLPLGVHRRSTAARAHRQAARHPRPAAARQSPAAMDLLYALDDRFQDGDRSSRPRWRPSPGCSASTRSGSPTTSPSTASARPVRRTLDRTVDGGARRRRADSHLGAPVEPNVPRLPMIDERSLADPRATAPVATVDLYPIEPPGADRARRGPRGRRVRQRRRARRRCRRRAARR